MASLCLQFPVDCYKPGPTRPDHKGDPFPSRLGVDPQLEKLAAPPGSRLPHLAAWTEDFLASGKGMPDDEFLQIYKVFAKLYPKEAQVPLEYMEEFEQKHAADRPEIWQIQKARDVVPPPPPDPPAPSPPPSGSPSEPAASTAKVTNDPAGLHVLLGSPPPSPPPSPPGGSDSEEDDQREAAAEERNAVSDMAKSAAKPLDQRKREREDQRNKAARKEARQSQAMLKPQRAVAASWAKKPQAAAGAAGAAAAGAAGEAAAGAAEATEPEAGEEPAAAADEAGFRAEVDRLKAELCAATAEIERLKAENETLKAEKRARESVEAALPEGTTWTFAEQYVLQPGTESLVGLVGEKLEAMTGAPVVCVVGTPKPSLIVHHPGRGYVSDHEQVGSLLQQLLAAVRRAVAAVEVDEDVQEELDQTMRGNLEKVRTLAGKITESDVSKALISHLRLNPANVLTLDTQRGILNLVGDQIATYDRETCTVALVDRDPDRHLVSRTTGVDCACLKPELGQSQQDVYSEFKSTKLNRWIIDPEARQYVLCAAGSALFGGDTTNIKSSLLVIGGPDQGKTALLNAIVAAGGWQPASAGSVNTSGCYSFSGANPQSLRGKASVGTARSGVLDIGDGLRLLAFNELESGDVWAGVKTLANAELPSITTKKQSSGALSVQSVSTPYALLSCNLEKRPPPPQTDVKTKVAVITPAMLGRFVDTAEEADGKTTFKKQAIHDSNDSAMMLRAMREALQAHAAAHPGESFDHERHMPACMREARDDPATWASGGSRGGGGSNEEALSDVKKAEAVQELRDGYSYEEKAGEIVILRDLIAKLPRAFLLTLSLGNEKEVTKALNSNAPRKYYATLEHNLLSVVLTAFPTCTIEENTTGRQGFKGLYIDGLFDRSRG